MRIHQLIRDVVSAATGQGWTVDQTNSGHIKLTSPKGAVVFTAGSPSDWRVRANLLSRLRRAGLAWPAPGRRKAG